MLQAQVSGTDRVHGFPPIARRDARVLILGSMPGEASLKAGQYYGHPRNAFWPILANLLGFDHLDPYEQRVEAVRNAGIAVWDVLASCIRPGSADADIATGSIAVNDFAKFFREHPDIAAIYCNGSMADTLFRRHVCPHVPSSIVTYDRLPSTSPAHAARSLTDKIAAWRVVLDSLKSERRRLPNAP